MSVRGAAFLGIGSMIGAGIFALLGEAGAVAGAAVWISFLLGGSWRGCSATTSSSWACVSILGWADRLPRRGVRERAAGRGRLVAGLHRGDRDRHRDGCGLVRQLRDLALRRQGRRRRLGQPLHHGVVLAMAGDQPDRCQARRPRSVADRLRRCSPSSPSSSPSPSSTSTRDLLAFSGYPSLSKIVASVALTFFAYLGFNVITFTGGDLREPGREIPKAMYLALGVTAR